MQIVAYDAKARIECWLSQIESIAEKAIAELEPEIARSWKGVHTAHARRSHLEAVAKRTGLPKDIAAAERAFQTEKRALVRAQPDAWFAAQNARREAQLVRRAVAEGNVEDAVEATFGAMNAAWRLTGEQIDPFVQAGVKARDAARRGGRARAAKRRPAWEQRNEAILESRAKMLATHEQSPEEVRLALAEKYGCSLRTIDRVVQKTSAKHVSQLSAADETRALSSRRVEAS
jgi:hypothetical protein